MVFEYKSAVKFECEDLVTNCINSLEKLRRSNSRIDLEEYGKEEYKFLRAVLQIYGYMSVNNLLYGVLSTYTQTWFLKRDNKIPESLHISPGIQCVDVGENGILTNHIIQIKPFIYNL